MSTIHFCGWGGGLIPGEGYGPKESIALQPLPHPHPTHPRQNDIRFQHYPLLTLFAGHNKVRVDFI